MEPAVMTLSDSARGEQFFRGIERIVVAGLGRSGQAAAALAARFGLTPTVVDSRSEEALAPALASLGPGACFVAESAAAPVLARADLVVLSPGIDPRREPYASALAAGVRVVSEIEVGWRFVESPLVAITGSNGKSTVTAMIAALLQHAGLDARACGNIGQPLSDALLDQSEKTRFVVEVSSFQLERIVSFAPDVAVLLNITPDHQDRYPDLASYAQAKERIFDHQSAEQTAIVCGTDDASIAVSARLAHRRQHGGPERLTCGADTIEDGVFTEGGQIVLRRAGQLVRLGRVSDIPLRGPHNLVNALAATATASCLGVDATCLSAALADLRALPHRLEPVGQAGGIAFVNDSKATNVASTAMALRSFTPKSVHVILGGRDKGADFASLVPALSTFARTVFAIGEAGPRIVAGLSAECLTGRDVTVSLAPDLAAAFAVATRVARPGDTVLLSPACASFDAYASFEERGEHFRALVADWVAEH
ncbi:MAG: UDP-N-acetylmuramoyl-L-alanine--D-glutamate ligase [Acidobacteriota bacterium]